MQQHFIGAQRILVSTVWENRGSQTLGKKIHANRWRIRSGTLTKLSLNYLH